MKEKGKHPFPSPIIFNLFNSIWLGLCFALEVSQGSHFSKKSLAKQPAESANLSVEEQCVIKRRRPDDEIKSKKARKKEDTKKYASLQDWI